MHFRRCPSLEEIMGVCSLGDNVFQEPHFDTLGGW